MSKKRQLETIISTLKRRTSEKINDTGRLQLVFNDNNPDLNNSQSSSGNHDVNKDVPPTPDSSPSSTDTHTIHGNIPSCNNGQPQKRPLSPVSPIDEFIPDDSDLENGPDQYLIDVKKQFEYVDDGQRVDERDWSRSMLEEVETWSSDDDVEWSEPNSPNHQSSQEIIRQPHNVDECNEQAVVETDDDYFDPDDYVWGDEDDKEPAAISHVPSPD